MLCAHTKLMLTSKERQSVTEVMTSQLCHHERSIEENVSETVIGVEKDLD